MNDFVTYMDQRITSNGMKRKDIAQKAAMSPEYVYKLLNGSKHTKNRDYILSLCIASGLNLEDTQQALRLYPFPVLGETNRDHMISRALEDGLDIDDLDDRLFNAGLNILVRDRGTGLGSYTIVNQRCNVEPSGEDCYMGFAEMRLRSDNGEMRYLLIFSETMLSEEISPDNPEAQYFVLDRSMYPWLTGTVNIPQHKVIECFDKYEDTESSEFFPYFRRLERLFEDEWKKCQKQEDDTAYSPKEYLCTGKFECNGMQLMCELYMYTNGWYVQVIQNGDEYRFSATEESYLHLWSLGDEWFSATKLYPVRIHFIENDLTITQAQISPYWEHYEFAKDRIPEYMKWLKSNSPSDEDCQ